LDRGSQMVLHLANINNGVFPSAQTVDFIANTSHQDFAMISTNMSLHWLFINDYDKRYPDVAASNPGDHLHDLKIKIPKPHLQATPFEKVMSASLFGGSLLSLILFFTALPFIFPPNWKDEDEPKPVVLNSEYPAPATPWGHTTSLLDPRNSMPRTGSIPKPKASLAPDYMATTPRAASPLATSPLI
jgi:hypothetical protein